MKEHESMYTTPLAVHKSISLLEEMVTQDIQSQKISI